MSSQGGPSAPAAWGTAFAELRAAATARAAVLGPPTTALEDWRYVQLAPLKQPIATSRRAVTVSEIDTHRVRGLPACIVFVDGAYRADLSNLASIPAQIAVDDLLQLSESDGRLLVARWRAELDATDDLAICWSFADCVGGARLRVRGLATAPVHVLSFATGGASAGRIVIELSPGAALDLAVSQVALGRSRSCLGIEVEAGQGSSLRVDELQYGPAAAAAQLFPANRLDLARDAQVSWTSARAGAELARTRVRAELGGVGCALELRSLSVLDGQRQAHDVVRLAHRSGQNTSTQLFKNIVDGSAIASFDGLVAIDHGADLASAAQRNNNLLLSAKARVDTRPQLDILADDVKASHGATVGQLDADELFYLRARGIGAEQARTLLTGGFAAEVSGLLRQPGMRELAGREVLGSLAG